MSVKKESRHRRGLRSRMHQRESGVVRLCVHRTAQHIYAQVIDTKDHIVASASTLEKAVKAKLKGHAGNKDAAALVGKMIAERAKEKGVEKIAFDRSGFRFHGRLKSLADAAREGGLQF